MSTEGSLDEQARQFAESLTATVTAVVGECQPFIVTTVDGSSGAQRVRVSQAPSTGVVLRSGGDPFLTLEAEYWGEWDHQQTFLRIDRSKITVFYRSKEPLFRYEYEASLAAPNLPGAHLHVHEAPDVFGLITSVLHLSGESTPRSKRRARNPSRVHQQDLHFPLGGPRFRPILEDVLHVLIEECGVDKEDGWEARLTLAREEWRLRQVAAAVRDAPDIAAGTLTRLGFTVTPPPEMPPRNIQTLRAL